ncbi:MAG: hypothetical protein WB997_14070 [Candidatus Acidiferrales bacterium]
MRRYIAGILLIVGLAAATAWADDFWAKKNWKEWSKGECNKILDDSPWAQRKIVENSSALTSQPSASRTVDPSLGGTSNLGAGEVTYRVRLLSAEPVREAMIRQEQIEKNYDKMTDDQKKSFDAQMDQKMAKHPDSILIHVIFEGNTANLKTSLATYWESFPSDAIPQDVYITTDGGTRILPRSYTVKMAENEFDLVFPRSSNDQPVVAPGAKSVKLMIKNPKIGDFKEKMITFEFKLDKMSFGGKLEY